VLELVVDHIGRERTGRRIAAGDIREVHAVDVVAAAGGSLGPLDLSRVRGSAGRAIRELVGIAYLVAVPVADLAHPPTSDRIARDQAPWSAHHSRVAGSAIRISQAILPLDCPILHS